MDAIEKPGRKSGRDQVAVFVGFYFYLTTA